MSVDVRVAVPGDAMAMGSLHVRGWQRAYRGMVPDGHLDELDVEERGETWRQILLGVIRVEGVPIPLNVVATVDDEVVGLASIGLDRDDASQGELWAMYVDPDHWRGGVGSALMAETMNEFGRLDVTTATLWVLEHNDGARRFYERHGWHSDDVIKIEELGGAAVPELRYSRSLV